MKAAGGSPGIGQGWNGFLIPTGIRKFIPEV